MASEAPTRIDGRRARRERSRLAVIDAMIDLIRRGDSVATAEIVAEHAGVSVASLFRYFPNLQDLQLETTARFFDRYSHLFEIPDIGTGDFAERVGRYVSSRTALHDVVAPVARFARAQSSDRPHLAIAIRQQRQKQATQLRKHFAVELRDLSRVSSADLVGVVISITSFESWDMMRTDLSRSQAQIKRAWAASVETLLDPQRRP